MVGFDFACPKNWDSLPAAFGILAGAQPDDHFLMFLRLLLVCCEKSVRTARRNGATERNDEMEICDV